MAEQEVKPCKFVNGFCLHCEATKRGECEGWVCPPQRPWVGLTDEEYQQILIQHDGAGLIAFYNLIESTLRSKNT